MLLKGLQGFGVRLFQLRCCDQGRCFALRGPLLSCSKCRGWRKGKRGRSFSKIGRVLQWVLVFSEKKLCVGDGREGGGVCVCRGAANVLGGNGGGRWCAADLVLHTVCTLTSLWCELGGCPCQPWVAFGVTVPAVSSQLALAKGAGAPGRVSPPAPRDGAGGRQTRGWCLRSLLIL